MTRAKWYSLLPIFAALLALTGFAAAQTPVEPVILNVNGDLWAWEGAGQPLAQLTDWRHNSGASLSPDGTRIAYPSSASVFVDWLQTVQGAGGFVSPENIWILDLPSRQTFRIADQPADAVYNGPEQPGKYTLRSALTWSPDGTQLAWVELRVEPSAFAADTVTNIVHLIIYDLVSRTTRELEPSPVTTNRPRGGVEWFDIVWGEAGLALAERSPGMTPAWRYRIYNPADGTRLAAFGPVNTGASAWLTVDGQDYLFDPQKRDTLLDWRTGEMATMPHNLEIFSRITPDGAYFSSADGDAWTLHLPGQAPVELGDDVRPYGISRDGTAALYGRYELIPAIESYGYMVVHHSAAGAVDIGGYRNVTALAGPVAWRVAD